MFFLRVDELNERRGSFKIVTQYNAYHFKNVILQGKYKEIVNKM